MNLKIKGWTLFLVILCGLSSCSLFFDPSCHPNERYKGKLGHEDFIPKKQKTLKRQGDAI